MSVWLARPTGLGHGSTWSWPAETAIRYLKSDIAGVWREYGPRFTGILNGADGDAPTGITASHAKHVSGTGRSHEARR